MGWQCEGASVIIVFIFNYPFLPIAIWHISLLFSMFLSTSQNVLPDHILNAVKHHLYGITSMQVCVFLEFGPAKFWNLFISACFIVVLFWYYYDGRCWIWEASSKGYVATPLDGPNFKCLCWCGPRESISWGSSSWCYKGNDMIDIVKIIDTTKIFHCSSTILVCSVYDSFVFIQGAAIDRILGEIVHSKSMTTPIDYVLCIGHFLGKVISST